MNHEDIEMGEVRTKIKIMNALDEMLARRAVPLPYPGLSPYYARLSRNSAQHFFEVFEVFAVQKQFELMG